MQKSVLVDARVGRVHFEYATLRVQQVKLERHPVRARAHRWRDARKSKILDAGIELNAHGVLTWTCGREMGAYASIATFIRPILEVQ